MSGVCGFAGEGGGDPQSLIASMRSRLTWKGPGSGVSIVGRRFALGAEGPAETIGALDEPDLAIVFQGHGAWLEETSSPLAANEVCARLAQAYRARGADAIVGLGGDFAVAIVDVARMRSIIAVDRMGVRSLVYRRTGGALTFAANVDSLRAASEGRHDVNPQAIYDYVYFHMVPGPETVYRDVLRVLPGHVVSADPDGIESRPYWRPRFRENEVADFGALRAEFRDLLEAGVAGLVLPGRTGTFLSGGTDSSTITGMLARRGDGKRRSFSIGFDASGYDEMEYARIAARHFASDHREYYVTPQDVLDAIPMIADEYDQPFGNSSAVPAYYCAILARNNGVSRMLAGDGGDELFAGNSRYARQYQFSLYEKIPAALRTSVLDPILRQPIAAHVPALRKAASYARQASLPMPERYESYNLLERIGPATVFAPDFLATVDRARPLAMLADVYRATDARSLVNRMLALDFKFTLADNDLPKVTRMCDRAGVDVAFPMLIDPLVEFSAGLPPRLKLRGTRLRYFFKEALRGFLPPEIIAKKKHGFGLPAGPWLATHAPLRALSRESMANLKQRHLFRAEFIDSLLDAKLSEHAAYYGTMVWVLMMLELWFQRHVD